MTNSNVLVLGATGQTDALLVCATIATGLIAGLFFTYANNVMPALRGADDAAFVDVMQRINRVILNPLFLGTFTGGLVLSAGAAIALTVDEQGYGLAWAVAGVALYGATVAITQVVNIPLNIELDATGVRQRFERRWNRWNRVRAVASCGAFASLTMALLAQ